MAKKIKYTEGGHTAVPAASPTSGSRKQAPRATVAIPSGSPSDKGSGARVQPKRKTVAIPKAKGFSMGNTGPEQDNMGLATSTPIDHGPRKDEGHYPSPPRKRAKKITGKIKK